MKSILKKEKGFAATDGIMAILIISLFTGIIATILYNIYISNVSLKRMSTATLYIVDMFEYVDKIDYEDLDLDNDANAITEEYSFLELAQNSGTPEDQNLQRMWKIEGEPEKGYSVILTLDKYNPNNEAQDLVRQLTMTVNYKVGNRNQEITMTRVKTK